MKIIKKDDLHFFKYCNNSGNYSRVHKCSYHDIIYAYKEFKNIDLLLEFLPKIKKLGMLNINGSILPKYLISNNDSEIISYLTEWCDDCILDKYYRENMNEGNTNTIVNILNSLKQNILILHRHGIIHGDIHSSNILVNPSTCFTNIIDFDNCDYKNFKINPEYCTWFARNYITRYGINKKLDIFLFNYLTVILMNDLTGYEDVQTHIINGENTQFKENDDYKNICDTLLLEAKKPSDKFLIDNYQKVLK